MTNVAVLAGLGGVAVAGLLGIATRLLGWKKRKRFAEAFLSRFRLVAHQELFDEDGYAWLVARSDKMQQRLGPLGLLEPYAMPYEYDTAPLPADPLLVNTLPELRSGRVRPERLAQCEEAMIRYLGALDDERSGYTRQCLNPMIWLGEGVRSVLLLPFLTLHWLGLFKETLVERLAENAAFRLLSGLIAVLGLAAAAAIITLGWEAFLAFTRQWLGAVLS